MLDKCQFWILIELQQEFYPPMQSTTNQVWPTTMERSYSYSCALLSDILLQGTLYITTHRFAFHSKIFGYETIKLFPLSDVIKIKKQRTVKIIPNAIGVYTKKKKYIFGSLISRNVTFKLMCHVLKTSMFEENSLLDVDDPILLIPEEEEEEDDDSCNGSGENHIIINTTESASIGSESEHSDEVEDVSETIRRMSKVGIIGSKRKSIAVGTTMDKYLLNSSSATANTTKKRKSNHVYEAEKRKRGFVPNWKDKFPWIKMNDTDVGNSLKDEGMVNQIWNDFVASNQLNQVHKLTLMQEFSMPYNGNWEGKDVYKLQEIRHHESMKRLQSSIEIHITQLNQVRNALESLVGNIPQMTEQSKQYEEMVTLNSLDQASAESSKIKNPAIKIIRNGHNLVLTGQGGTGKNLSYQIDDNRTEK
ncbi:Protein VASCULAR ASSOCIATED DEATH 1, chloroplastic [Nymphon striatum]|nr:Protein VASCULAR ASSOCIATED DEATH 1, chloroplastic [Nymphon striatum]